MRISPTPASVQAALLAASHDVAAASYLDGAPAIVGALGRSQSAIDSAAHQLEALCADSHPASHAGTVGVTSVEDGACAARHVLAGLRDQVDDAIEVARTAKLDDGRLPVGTVDPVFAGLEQAANKLFASRWG